MPLLQSDCAIILTDDPVMKEILPVVFSRHGISTEHSPELADTAALRNRMSADGNTSFMRKVLLDFLRSKGLPAIIAMDFRLKSGLSAADDPDSMKTVRMLVASCILFSRLEGFENFTAQILLLGKSSDALTAELEKNPQYLLGGIRTPNESLNTYIDELRSDGKKFRSIFMIRLIHTDSDREKNVLEADIFTRSVLARRNLSVRDKVVDSRTAMDNGSDVPAGIFLKLPDGKIFRDGIQLAGETDESGRLKPDVITVAGCWNHRTQRIVAEKLTNLIQHGIQGEKTFTPQEEIVILGDDRCRMDGSTAVSIAGMIVRELSAFPRLTILVSRKNESLLRNAQGYSLIRKHLFILDE